MFPSNHSTNKKICSKCKAVNQLQSNYCNNINCNQPFPKRRKPPLRNSTIDSSKLIADNTIHTIYSVKIRKSGPDYRGFVTLENNTNDNKEPSIQSIAEKPSNGLCFIKSCKHFNNGNCEHVQTAITCKNKAEPLYMDPFILEKLKIKSTVKQEILRLSSKVTSPLIQRISKHVIVVKAKKSEKHPLGYLHMLFQIDKNRYYCSCGFSKLETTDTKTYETTHVKERKKCIHFYICICAFASDIKLTSEFQYFVDLCFQTNPPETKTTETKNKDHNINYSLSLISSESNIQQSDGVPMYIESGNATSFTSKPEQPKIDQNRTIHLNNMILLETDKINEISDDCDVYLARDDNQNVKNSEKPLDIQIMLADSSDIIKFPSLQDIPISSKSTSYFSKKDFYSNIKKETELSGNNSASLDNSNFFILPDDYTPIEITDYSNDLSDDDDTDFKVINTSSISNFDDDLLFLSLNNDTKIDKTDDCIIATISNEDIVTDMPRKTSSSRIKHKSKKTANNNNISFLNDNVSDIITVDATLANTSDVNAFNIIDLNKILQGQNIEIPMVGTVNNTQETQVNLPFLQWLSSVTEQINQTMHFQFSGTPKTLTYQIPQTFFECLRSRMCPDVTKKRLPNLISEIHRTDSLPLGIFTKYTWEILKLAQLKKIFDTPNMPLKIIKYFSQNSDSTYTEIENPELNDNKGRVASEQLGKTKLVDIQPGFLITYLKVGKLYTNTKTQTPFLIEWMPNILPKSKVGELTLVFQFGHKNNYYPRFK